MLWNGVRNNSDPNKYGQTMYYCRRLHNLKRPKKYEQTMYYCRRLHILSGNREPKYTLTGNITLKFFWFRRGFAGQWAKREKEDTLSEWVKSVLTLALHFCLFDVYNFKVTSYNVASRIIYEWGTCTGAFRRLRFNIVNIEIMQHVFVVK
jgi:hypothetical protein